MATREELESAWDKEVGASSTMDSLAEISRRIVWSSVIASFIQRNVPRKQHSESELAEISRRIVERSSDQTPFSIFADSLFGCGISSGSGGEEQELQDAWKAPFDQPFRDPGNQITTYILGKLDRCVLEFYASQTYSAPFVPIVQSSGWGKSKLMKHMASQGIVVFYFCLLDKLSSGYPRADPQIASVFASVKTDKNAYAIFHACLQWLHEQDRVPDLDELFSLQQCGQWPESLKQKIVEQNECSKEEMQQAFSAVWRKFPGLRDGVRILFVVDEARQLLRQTEGVREMPFTLFRRASLDFSCPPSNSTSGALVVVIDTFGKVSNFTPTAVRDTSARVAIGGKYLFTPISAFPTFNLFPTPQPVLTLQQAAVPLTLFTRGRPLWAATLLRDKDATDDMKAVKLLKLAQTKLMGGWDDKLFEDPKSSLVLLGRRIAVDVCPQDKVAEELVASHMHVCLHTSASREFILTMVLPEPVLAQAAADMLLPGDRVAQQLLHLNACMLKGLVSAGERGELVARFLLVNAMDELNRGRHVKPQRLELFLQKLTKGKWPGFGPDAAHLKEALVFFNAFYPYFGRNPTYKTLLEFIRNAGALICRQGQEAYDLYIPFVTPNEKGEYDLSEQNVQGLAVQVKNRKDIVNSADVLQKMSSHAFSIMLQGDGVIPRIFLVLQLGENELDGQCLHIHNANQISIALEGLNAVSYNAAWKESLVTLLRERPDPKSVLRATQTDQEAVGHILKQLYDPVELVQAQGPSQKGKQVASGATSTPLTHQKQKTSNLRKRAASGATSIPLTHQGKQAVSGDTSTPVTGQQAVTSTPVAAVSGDTSTPVTGQQAVTSTPAQAVASTPQKRKKGKQAGRGGK